MGDLGVRVQTSGTGDPTAKAAIENVMIMEAIQKGNLEGVTSELDEQSANTPSTAEIPM